jgi:hypothetical protein
MPVDHSGSKPTPNEFDDINATMRLVRLFGYYAIRYCEDNDVPLPQRSHIDPHAFGEWLSDRLSYNDYDEREAVLKATNCEDLDWEKMRAILDSPGGITKISAIWGQVAMHYRAAPQNPLESIHLIALLKYADGKAVPLSSFIPKELVVQCQFTDGRAADLVANGAHMLANTFYSVSIDALHNESAVQADEFIFEMLMGVCQQVIPQIKPEFHDRLKNMQRLLQSMFRPPLSADVRKLIQDTARRHNAELQGKPHEPIGGFDA